MKDRLLLEFEWDNTATENRLLVEHMTTRYTTVF